jgi:hypothetical protein
MLVIEWMNEDGNGLLAFTSAPFDRNSLTRSSPSLRLTAIIKGVHPAPSYSFVSYFL